MLKEKRVTDLENHVFDKGPKWPRAMIQRDGKLYYSSKGDEQPLTPEQEKEWRSQADVVIINIDIPDNFEDNQ